jgi:hypothetical protein
MAHDVFISYSRMDKPTADAVCATLEQNGIRCWIAPRDVLPGMEWGKAIVNAIHNSQFMVVVFTARANQSDHVSREVERAVAQGISIIPLRIEDIVPSNSLEYFIGSVHWLDALTPPLEDHLKELASKLRFLMGKEATYETVKPVSPVRPPAKARKPEKRDEATEVRRFCTKCGAENFKKSRFCPGCGMSLVIAGFGPGQCG